MSRFACEACCRTDRRVALMNGTETGRSTAVLARNGEKTLPSLPWWSFTSRRGAAS
jgi:hypothetical protein